MNYRIAKGSKRLYAFDADAEEENEVLEGYVDELHNGNLLVCCGFQYGFFNKKLYKAIEPYIIDHEKNDSDDPDYLYLYEVSPDAKEHLKGIVKENDDIMEDLYRRKWFNL